MTGPVVHGYRDYNTQLLRSDQVYVNDANVVADSFVKNVGYVGNTQYLGFLFRALARNWVVSFLYYADAAFTTLLETYAFEPHVNDFIDISVPVYGPHLKVTGVSSAAGASYTLTVWNVSAAALAVASGSTSNALIAVNAQNIAGGGGAFTFDATRVVVTPLILSINTASTNWTAKLSGSDVNGVLTPLGFVANDLKPHDLYPDAQHLQVVVSNFQAGAATFDVMLVAKPGTA